MYYLIYSRFESIVEMANTKEKAVKIANELMAEDVKVIEFEHSISRDIAFDDLEEYFRLLNQLDRTKRRILSKEQDLESSLSGMWSTEIEI